MAKHDARMAVVPYLEGRRRARILRREPVESLFKALKAIAKNMCISGRLLVISTRKDAGAVYLLPDSSPLRDLVTSPEGEKHRG